MTTNHDFDMADAHADRELEAADRARRSEWDERERVEMHEEAFRLRQEREAAADRVQRYFASIGHPDFFTRARLLNIVSAVLAEPAQEF